MNTPEIKNQLTQIATSWKNFKDVNDQRLKEIESKGHSDPLLTEQLNKINLAIDTYQKRMDKLEIALNRPQLQDSANNNALSYNIDLEYKNAFCSYIRSGNESNLINLEYKTFNINNLAKVNSGYAITTKMKDTITAGLNTLSVMRKLSNVIEISTDQLEILGNDEMLYSGWSEDALSKIEELKPVYIEKINIPIHELYAQPKTTQKLIDDPSIDVESWLSNKLVETFYFKEDEAFIKGDGNGKPKGLLNYINDIKSISTGIDGGINTDALIKLYYALPEKYSENAKFLTNRDVIHILRTLKDKNDQYLYQPNLTEPDKLFGCDVLLSPHIPSVENGSYSLIVGDFKAGYQIVDRQNIRVLRDPFTHKPYIKFYSTKRVGGGINILDAIRLMKFSA